MDEYRLLIYLKDGFSDLLLINDSRSTLIILAPQVLDQECSLQSFF
jgi:hypothetical protein